MRVGIPRIPLKPACWWPLCNRIDILMTKPSITSALVDKILALDYAALPPEAIDMAKAVTLDGLAVMIAGANEPLGVGRISIKYVREMGGAPQASVITGGFKTSMPNAAYANGTMAHA